MLKAVDLDDSVLISAPAAERRTAAARLPGAALAVEPKLLILDEAVSNLDLVIQAGVIRLLKKLQQHHRLSVYHPRFTSGGAFCQRVMVMDEGQIVETGRDALTFLPTPVACYKMRYFPPFPCAVIRFKTDATYYDYSRRRFTRHAG
jgi:nickel transport system ATP-binding protein